MLRLTMTALLLASPAAAAVEGKPFFSLYNTDLIVLAAFLIFVGILVYAKVPNKITGFLDARGLAVQAELAEARRLREDAIEVYASFERKHNEVKEQAARIVEKAKADAELVAAQTKADIEASIIRRLRAAEDQIASAEAAAIRDVREKATNLAIAAAGDLIAKQMDSARSDALVAKAVQIAQSRLH